MKPNTFFSFIIGAFIGGALMTAINDNNEQKKNEMQTLIDESRYSTIEFNKEFNHFYSKLGLLSFGQNNSYATIAVQILQALSPKLIQLNKSLKLDCTLYDDGAPLTIQDSLGIVRPMETIPEEIRLLE